MFLQIGLAFGAGLLSFLSPCTLPLYPAYILRLTGLSYKEISDPKKSRQIRNRIMLHTAVFITGISLIYYMLSFSASLFGQWLSEYWLRMNWFLHDRRAMNVERPVGSISVHSYWDSDLRRGGRHA
jgi:cytochrome c biogenesis protein CcdA